MNAENMRDLAKLRYERAVELLNEAEEFLISEHFKSANNRAYYCAEKSIKAVLALRGKDAETHKGVVMLFNEEYIRRASPFFDHDDLCLVSRMERIRSASDYDDFYIANKAECVDQVEQARNILSKVTVLLKSVGVIE